jgi:hypothetical protein
VQQGLRHRAVWDLQGCQPSWQLVKGLYSTQQAVQHNTVNTSVQSSNSRHTVMYIVGQCTTANKTTGSCRTCAQKAQHALVEFVWGVWVEQGTRGKKTPSHLQCKVPASPQLQQPSQVPQWQCGPAAPAAAGCCCCCPAHCDLQLAQLRGQVLQLVCVVGQVPQQQAGACEGCEGAGGWQQQLGAGTQHCEVL